MNKKYAFSLMEVLLVMGIIAVIIAIGFSISKRGVEKAYNQYWYTGYSALSDATMDAVLRGKMDTSNPTASLGTYSKYIAETLMRSKNYSCNSSKASFTAPNGISYIIEPKTGFYQITMSIPQHKQKTVSRNQTIFIYNFAKAMIYPANISAPTSTQLSLYNRVDLLPFYIKLNDANTGTVTNFYGFKDAYCLVDTSISANIDDIAKISCSATPSINGVIVPINPRKIY